MPLRVLALIALLCTVVGCVVRPAVVAAPPPVPPPHQELVPVSPGPAHVWVPGHWAWRGHRPGYVWVPGHWAVPRSAGYVWVPGAWVARPGGYVWVEGHWRQR